jgi:hypothetical protein
MKMKKRKEKKKNKKMRPPLYQRWVSPPTSAIHPHKRDGDPAPCWGGWKPSPLKTQEWVSTPSIGWTSIERENENGEPTRGVPLVEGIMILK